MNKTLPNKKHNEGIAAIVVVAIVVVLALGAGAYLYTTNSVPRTAAPTLPPVAERTNPDPATGYSIEVGNVAVGNTVTVNSVNLAKSASIVVLRDGKTQTELGRSATLTAGTHSNVSINLSQAIKDGDVLFIRLKDSSGASIQNDAKVNIEVVKYIGDQMVHYDNEY